MEEMLSKAQSGNTKAFEEIIKTYEKYIYVIAYNIMHDKEDAMDISQEVAIKIYRNLKSCKSESSLKAWIGRITHNACMDALRKRKGKTTQSLNQIQDDQGDRLEAQMESKAKGPEELMIEKEEQNQIRDILKRLSPNLQSLIILRDVEGHSYEEISQILSLPEGTVKSRLFRARAKFKELLMMEQIHIGIRHIDSNKENH